MSVLGSQTTSIKQVFTAWLSNGYNKLLSLVAAECSLVPAECRQ